MSATDLNNVFLDAGFQGLHAATERFTQRMEDIKETRREGKDSAYWREYSRVLAHRVDDLTKFIHKQEDVISHKDKLLGQMNEQLLDTNMTLSVFRLRSTEHSAYADLLIKRLTKVEDILQRQSARSFALDEFCKLAISELATIKNPAESTLLDPVARQKTLEAAWDTFMATTTVKKGLPRYGIDQS